MVHWVEFLFLPVCVWFNFKINGQPEKNQYAKLKVSLCGEGVEGVLSPDTPSWYLGYFRQK